MNESKTAHIPEPFLEPSSYELSLTHPEAPIGVSIFHDGDHHIRLGNPAFFSIRSAICA